MDSMKSILDAHNVIRACAGDLLETQEVARALELVGRLAAVLPDHFAEEERPGGWFDRIRRHQPGAAIDELVLEHQDLEATAQLLQSYDTEHLPPHFLDDARALARRIQEHERKETRLASSHG